MDSSPISSDVNLSSRWSMVSRRCITLSAGVSNSFRSGFTMSSRMILWTSLAVLLSSPCLQLTSSTRIESKTEEKENMEKSVASR